MEIERSITINRPVAQVFAFVSNPENNKQWQPEVIEHKMVSEGPMALGSKMRHVSKFMGRRIESNLDINEFVPNQKIAFHVTSGTLPYTIHYPMCNLSLRAIFAKQSLCASLGDCFVPRSDSPIYTRVAH